VGSIDERDAEFEPDEIPCFRVEMRQERYLPYISPISPLYLPCISPISPLYLPCFRVEMRQERSCRP
jgi:hypothetical protein